MKMTEAERQACQQAIAAAAIALRPGDIITFAKCGGQRPGRMKLLALVDGIACGYRTSCHPVNIRTVNGRKVDFAVGMTQ